MAVCGLWQCGTKQFQMTLTRSFTNPGMTLPTGCATTPRGWTLKRSQPPPLSLHP